MVIVFSVDNKFSMPLGVALTSLFSNKKGEYEIKVYVLDGGIDKINKEKLKVIEDTYGFQINYIDMLNYDLSSFPELGRLNACSYYRLLAPEIIPEDKIIYLDCDTVVLDDLNKIFEKEINNENIISAVADLGEKDKIKYFFRPINGYFNAGVMVIDCGAYRKDDVFKKALDFVNLNKKAIKYADQDILNHLLEGRWLRLDDAYNVQQDNYQPPISADIKVLHYTGAVKPWHYSYENKMKKYFTDFLRKTPWEDYAYPDKNIKKVFLKAIKIIIRFLVPSAVFIEIMENYALITNQKEK